jgi:hypothetical protein
MPRVNRVWKAFVAINDLVPGFAIALKANRQGEQGAINRRFDHA